MKSFKRVFTTLLLSLFVILTMSMAVQAAPKLSKKKVTLQTGESVALKVKGAKGAPVVWNSTNNNIVRANTNGTIDGLAEGRADITASVKGKTLRCKVTVRNARLSKTSVTVKVKKKASVKITNPMKKKVKVYSSNKGVVTAKASKTKVTLTGKGAGSATVTVYVGKAALNLSVTVTGTQKPPKGKFAFSSSTYNLTISDSGKATIKFGTSGSISYSIADESIVDAKFGDFNDGGSGDYCPIYFTGLKSGTTTVTITNSKDNRKLDITVTVKQSPAKVFRNLANYISQNGYLSQNRARTIKYSYRGAVSAVSYNANNDQLIFTATLTTGVSKSVVSFNLSPNSPYISPKYIFVSTDGSYRSGTANAYTNIANVRGNAASVSFVTESNSNISRADLIDYAGTDFILGIAGWQTLLKSVGFDLKTLGFTSLY